MPRTATARVTAVLIAVATVVGGCGDDTDTASSETAAAPPAGADEAFPVVVTADNGAVEL